MVHSARISYLVVAWLFVVAVVSQVFLAGFSIFVGPTNWVKHMGFGHMIGVLPFILLVLALPGRIPRATVGLTALLFADYILQAVVFAFIRGSAPVVAALHPVNALFLFWLALTVALQARTFVRAPYGITITSRQPADPIAS